MIIAVVYQSVYMYNLKVLLLHVSIITPLQATICL